MILLNFTRKGRGTHLSLIFLRSLHTHRSKIECRRNSWRCAELPENTLVRALAGLNSSNLLRHCENITESLNDRILPCTAAFDSVGESIPCGNCTHRILFGSSTVPFEPTWVAELPGLQIKIWNVPYVLKARWYRAAIPHSGGFCFQRFDCRRYAAKIHSAPIWP